MPVQETAAKSSPVIEISVEEYQRLIARDLWLRCLEAADLDHEEIDEAVQEIYERSVQERWH